MKNKKISEEKLKQLAARAQSLGDNNLAIMLHVFLGARATHMDSDLAIHCQEWAKKRIEELKQFKKRGYN